MERPPHELEVRNPYDNSTVAKVPLADAQAFDRAADAAVAAAPAMARMPAYERAALLMHVSGAIAADRENIARTIAAEAGKPLKDALVETDRAAMTFHVAADEARRISGDVIPLDLAPHGAGRIGIVRRFPIGPIAAISPFNFPLNLSAHKLAPAIAAGNSIVLKPATKTPLSALTLGTLLGEAGAPEGAVSVLPMSRDVGDRLVTDPRFKLLTFTGSSPVGWAMKARAGRKKVILELGGNAGVIVNDDADVMFAAKRVAAGGFSFAGQSCISVQRVYVHERVFEAFASELVRLVEALKVGDPLDAATDVGPMIEEDEAARVDHWVRDAVAAGARVLTGGRRLGGAIYAPTVMADVPSHAKVCTEEVFAPLVGLWRFSKFEDAVAEVNRSRFGLQAGVFTRDLAGAFLAYEALEVGGVIINDVPAWRIDHMPYGGIKESGLGREGPRYTIEEMTEPKLMVINRTTS
ncbi:MAG: aldehyde dehydrogenase family protein [Vicinamibacterales bacterium]